MDRSAIARTMEELGVDRDSYRVLALLPLVYVAWADGKVQRTEASIIHKLAQSKGWLGGKGPEILAGWLAAPPTSEYVERGLALLRGLSQAERGPSSFKGGTLRELVHMCRDVAAAAGGHFGASPVTAEEEAALTTIAEAFNLDAKRWQAIVDEPLPDARDAPGPRGHLLLGSAPELREDPLKFVLDAAREHGTVVRIRLPGERVYLLYTPEHLRYVLIENAGNYVRGRDYDMLAASIGKGLACTEGETWRRSRRILQPAFHKKNLVSFGEVITGLTSSMLDGWSEHARSGQPVEMSGEMTRLTFRIIGQLLFNAELDDAAGGVGEAIGIALAHAKKVQTDLLHLPDRLPTPENVRFHKALRVFDDLLHGLIAERRRGAAPARPDLLGMLIEARDEETGGALGDEQLRDEMLTLLVAGHDTTMLVLTWTLYVLSKHPYAARRMLAEVEAVLGGQPPTVESIARLIYTQMVVSESMRLYPPLWAISRTAVSEDEIDGYTIPRGAVVVLSPWVTHRTPSVWENPEGFDPERFTPEASAARHPLAYWPLGAGPHKCVGMSLALMELHMILPMILQRYRLDLIPGFEPGYTTSVTMKPRHGMRMTVHARA